jgi:hypothetical protein
VYANQYLTSTRPWRRIKLRPKQSVAHSLLDGPSASPVDYNSHYVTIVVYDTVKSTTEPSVWLAFAGAAYHHFAFR